MCIVDPGRDCQFGNVDASPPAIATMEYGRKPMAVFLKHNDVEGYGQKEESGRTALQDATLPAFRVLTLPSRLLKPHAVVQYVKMVKW